MESELEKLRQRVDKLGDAAYIMSEKIGVLEREVQRGKDLAACGECTACMMACMAMSMAADGVSRALSIASALGFAALAIVSWVMAHG